MELKCRKIISKKHFYYLSDQEQINLTRTMHEKSPFWSKIRPNPTFLSPFLSKNPPEIGDFWTTHKITFNADNFHDLKPNSLCQI
jgi:hypothetical protein